MISNKRLFFTTLFLFFAQWSFSQIDSQPPVIVKIPNPKQVPGEPIIYQFPDTVNKVIQEYVNSHLNSESYFYIELKPEVFGYSLLVMETSKTELNDTSKSLGSLLNSCYRYCKLQNLNVPIYLTSDLELGSYNFTKPNQGLVIKLKQKSFHIFHLESAFVENLASNQSDSANISKFQTSKQVSGEPIFYHFPDSVYIHMEDYMKFVNGNRMLFYIELYANSDGYKLLFREIDSIALGDTGQFVESLLKSTHKYCKLHNRDIPIYLSSDKQFGFYNFTFTGRSLYIKLKRIKFGMLKKERAYISQ